MAGSNTSTLRVEVVSNGITEASRALGGLGRSAATTEKKVTSLTSSLGKLMNVQNSAIAKAMMQSTSISGVSTAMSQAGTQATQLTAKIQALSMQFDKLSRSARVAESAQKSSSKSSSIMERTLKGMATAAAAYIGFNVARSVVQQADAWTMLNAKLRIFTGSQQNANAAQYELFDMAQKYRAPMEDMGKLYTRLATPMRQMGKSHEETKEMVEGVTLALQLNGATAGEASSVMLQFSQAMAAGRLNGQEFNAVAENGSLILRALEEHTGKNAGELKKMGAEGKLTMDIIQQAIQKSLPKWREDFESLPVTVDSAMTRVKNAWLKAMGELNSDSGMSKGLVEALRVVEDMIPAIRDEMVSAFVAIGKWIGANRDGISQWWAQVKGLTSDVLGIVAGLFNAFSATSENVSIMEKLAATVFGVRLLLAGAVDMVKLIGASFVHVGLDIADIFTTPLRATLVILDYIFSGISKIFDLLAVGAKAAGLDAIASGLQKASGSYKEFSAFASDTKKVIDDTIQSGRDLANGWLEGWKTGETEVAKVLKVEQARVAAAKERSKYEQVLPLGNPGTDVDEKAEKALENSLKKQERLYEDHNESLSTAIAEQEELKRRMSEFGLGFEKLSEGAKEEIKLEYELANTYKITNVALREKKETQLLLLLDQARKLKAIEEENTMVKESLENEAREIKSIEEKIETTKREADEMERKVATYGMLKGAVEQLELAQLKERANNLRAVPEMQQYVEMLDKLIVQQERLATSKSDLGQLEAADEAKKALDKFLDPSKATEFGNAFASAFGKGGDAISKAVKALEMFDKRQKDVSKTKDAIDKGFKKGSKEQLAAMESLNKKGFQNTVSSYGDMAGAAKDFFSENSKGYKVMETAEKAFRAVELALAMESFVRKMFFTQTEQAAVVTAEGVKTAATAAGATASVTASMAEGQAAAVAGVANQAKGDPYTAWARMAMMAAMMAALGFAVSGGGGGASRDIAKERQEVQGTGSVLGDESAKSESIANSLELLRDNSNIALRHSSAMLTALVAIKDGISGMATFVAQTSGLRGTKQDEAKFGVGKTKSALGFSSSSTELLDTGIQFAAGQTVGSIVDQGTVARSYADIKKKKSSFWGLSSSTSYKTTYGDLEDELLNQISLTVGALATGVATATEALGLVGIDVEKSLKNFGVNISRISLKGLSGDEIAAELEAVFGKLGDDMAKVIMPGLDGFQKVGEGYFETLVRVSEGVERAKLEMDLLGIEMVDYRGLVNKQGDVAAELVRESILVYEKTASSVYQLHMALLGVSDTSQLGVDGLTAIGDIMKDVQGSASELTEAYTTLRDIQNNLILSGVGDEVTRAFLRGAGSLDKLKDATDSYVDSMFSDEEKYQMNMQKMQLEFGKMGLVLPATRVGFRSLVETLAASGEQGQEMAAKLMLLSDSFAELQDSMQETIDFSRDQLSEAYEREADALQTTIDKFKDFSDSLKEFRDSLLTGGMSPLTNRGKYEQALLKYNDTVSKAMAGDEKAISDFQSVANELLTLSREYNASGAAYTADFNRVMTESGIVAEYAASQVDIAEASLEALNDQVKGLLDINESVISVEMAVRELYAAMSVGTDGTSSSETLVKNLYSILLKQTADQDELAYYSNLLNSGRTYEEVKNLILENGGDIDGSHANGLSYVPFDNYKANLHRGEAVLTAAENRMYQANLAQYGKKSDESLVNEIKSLREELRQLRAEQEDQTNRMIVSNYDANNTASNQVVAGVDEAISTNSRKDAAKVALN